MLCERCNKKKSTMVYRENISGRVRVLHLCAECTEILEAAGELEELGAALSPFDSLFSQGEGGYGTLPFLAPTEKGSRINDRRGQATDKEKCPFCGMNAETILSTGRVGCAMCYETFGNTLAPMVSILHGKSTHTGHMTAAVRRRRERTERVARLKKQLKEAIASEQFERAAHLRDEIRSAESEAS